MAAAQPAYSDYVPIPCPKPKQRLRLVVSNPGKGARRNKKRSSYGERCIVISRARYYDPKVGRFVTKDPIGFKGGINVFAYVGNNPINAKDPKGLESSLQNPSGEGSKQKSGLSAVPCLLSYMLAELQCRLDYHINYYGCFDSDVIGDRSCPDNAGRIFDSCMKNAKQEYKQCQNVCPAE